MDQRAIGVFDSGVGGLTAVRQLKKILPGENIVYFGDTSRVPYGTRSRETIEKYALQDIRFLLSHRVKMVVAACGTVSANLSPAAIAGLTVAYTGVLQPTVKAACDASKNHRIGVLATPASIKSGAYQRGIKELLPEAEVVDEACPLFVPLIENGYIDKENAVTRLVAEEYLASLLKEKTDTIILGCTHYPIIKTMIGDIVGEDVRLIDSGKEVAKYVKSYLTEHDLLAKRETPGTCRFYVSDDVAGFAATAGIFLQDDRIADHVEQIDINQY